jgi:hypothetical protein
MSDSQTSKDVAREWREKELTFVVSALATALDLDDDEQRDALCDLREWAKNRLKSQLPVETTTLMEIARDISTMDCFYSGSTCAPDCKCIVARANKAVGSPVEPTPRQSVSEFIQEVRDNPEWPAVKATGRPLTEPERDAMGRALERSQTVVDDGSVNGEASQKS